MADKMSCIYCGGTVSLSGYCKDCGLGQEFLWKAGNTSRYYYNIALDKVTVRDLSGAIDSLKMSLRYNKSNTDARNLLGLIYYEVGNTVSALSNWVISVNHKPKDNLAVKYLKMLRDNPETLEKANELARTFNKGLELAKNHELDLAIIQLRKCISSNKKFVDAYLLLSLILIEQGREEMARKYLAQVVAIDRTNPIALDYLREMGGADVTKLADEAMSDSSDLFDYYGMEQADEKKRPARKIVPAEPNRARSLRRARTREQSLARFSNIYMFAGIVIGLALFYFLVSPAMKSKHVDEIQGIETSNNQALSAKNNEIENLRIELEDLTDKNNKYISDNSSLQTEIDNLEEEVELLKKSVEAGGIALPEEIEALENATSTDAAQEISVSSTGVTQNGNQYDSSNAAAERNNANVIGISTDSIEDIISNE